MKDEYALNFKQINASRNTGINAISNDDSSLVLLLDGLEDHRNLGAIFRLADAGGIADIFAFDLKVKNKESRLKRVARQTTNHIKFKELERVEDVKELAKKYKPIALEYTNKSISYKNYLAGQPCMLVLGNERSGISREVLDICEVSIHIPMFGQNSSMNVAVASGIAVYHLLETLGKI